MQSLQRLASRFGGNRARLTHMVSAAVLLVGTLAAAPIARGATNAPERRPAPPSFQEQVNAQLGLTASELTTLHIDPTPGQPLSVAVPLDGQVFTLMLMPRSVRSAFYQLYEQAADGSLVPVEPGPVRTLRGTLAESPGSVAAGSLMEDGLYATVLFPDGGRYWIEPLFGRVAGAAADQYVVYRGGNTICAGECGLNETNLHKQVQGPPQEDEGGMAGAVTSCVKLACDADFEYYTAHGSSVASVEAQINSVTNTMNVQYENDVNIRHEITTIIVRTSEPDPYTATDPVALLTQFRNEWLNNQGAVQRDVAELFTGKQIDGSVIGIAWTIGGICTSGAYCLVQSDFSANFACKTDLSAHEIGHLWGGTHCTCPTFTMNPSVTCANVHAPGSITEITNYKNSVSCDLPCEDGTTTLPFFDNFDAGTTINPVWWTGIDGATINTTGTAEPSAPNALNLDGSSNGGDELRSAIINTASVVELKVEFYYQRRGGGDSPETNDDLVVEFADNTGQWVEINRQLGSGADMTTFAFVSLTLPASAQHANFRLRFRAISTQVGLDDWFVDNVSITGIVPPANNVCTSATLVPVGSTPFTTLGASTDGPDEPAGCNFGGFTQIDKDVWFKHLVQCTGTLTVSLCGANYDAKMAIYSACPSGSNQAIACNDNFCGSAPQVSFNVVAGTVYRIRVGGFSGASGSGTMVITCTPTVVTGACCLPNGSCAADQTQSACQTAGGTYSGDGSLCVNVTCPQPCPADVNGSGAVNIDDLLAVINNWGNLGGTGDVNGSGEVNIDDLLSVINAWGPCP